MQLDKDCAISNPRSCAVYNRPSDELFVAQKVMGHFATVSSPPDFEKALDRCLSASEKRPDLDVIMTGAKESLELIKSWTQIQSEDAAILVFVDGIRNQTGPYVTAIDQSLKAAEQVWTFSADSAGLCDFLLDPDTISEGLAEYAYEMHQFASEATEAATSAMNRFRDIRRALFRIADEMNKAVVGTRYPQDSGIKNWNQSSTPRSSHSKSIDSTTDIEEVLKGLQKFAINVDGFANWWADLEVALLVIQKRAELSTSRIRIKQVKRSWEKVSEDYKTYKCKLRALRDQTEPWRIP